MRVAIDYGDVAERADGAGRALRALRAGVPAMWRILRNHGIYLGRGTAATIAFLYPGQGSQYVNMLAGLRASDPIVGQTFQEADQGSGSIPDADAGRALTDWVFVPSEDPDVLARAEQRLLAIDVAQPAMLTAAFAVTRLLAAYGVRPDMVMGHSLGEFAALVTARALTTLRAAIEAAVEGAHARIRRMVRVLGDDPGAMVAVLAPLPEVERTIAAVGGYIAVANVNSNVQVVVGGATGAVDAAVTAFAAAGRTTIRLPVSHAFHTPVTPTYDPLKKQLLELGFRPPALPTVANATGDFYPVDGHAVQESLDLACREVDEPVQFVKGLHALYVAGARVFVEVGPKRVLHGFAEDVLGSAYDDVLVLFTNSPKLADAVAF
ncbi:MAG TPA: acyltransferase domain-containing protein, partial [Mycobacteriales bacterium]|nr:acyltransferase domain-containing protein [Mycobacteriales bacterium]